MDKALRPFCISIGDDLGQRAWGALLARLLPQAYQDLVAVDQQQLLYQRYVPTETPIAE